MKGCRSNSANIQRGWQEKAKINCGFVPSRSPSAHDCQTCGPLQNEACARAKNEHEALGERGEMRSQGSPGLLDVDSEYQLSLYKDPVIWWGCKQT